MSRLDPLDAAGVNYGALAEEETCCGFGGVFSVEQPEISTAMLMRKIENIERSQADLVVACDAGCLMNIAGGLKKVNSPIKALHLIQVLAQQG